MMVIFLVGLVTMILMRTLRRDFARYQKEDELDDMVRGRDCLLSRRVTIKYQLVQDPSPFQLILVPPPFAGA